MCDDFDFDIVKLAFLDGDVLRFTSNGVDISKFIRFASHVTDFNVWYEMLTAKLLQ